MKETDRLQAILSNVDFTNIQGRDLIQKFQELDIIELERDLADKTETVTATIAIVACKNYEKAFALVQ